jgi:hypothetical protein
MAVYEKPAPRPTQPQQPALPVPPAGPVLSPWLYHLLDTKVAGGVLRVIRPGRRIERQISHDIQTEQPRTTVVAWGEMYEVCCPFCDDHTGQLRVSQIYGLLDADGNDNLHLAFCNHRSCLKDRGNRQRLAELVFGELLAQLHEVRTDRLMAAVPAAGPTTPADCRQTPP